MKLRERLNLKRMREGYVREEPVSAARLPARRRRMLLISMIVVLPLGVFAFGTGINVALASGSVNSFNAGDFQGSASWARASVSLNPFDKYTPHYNLGTAYAAGDLLPEAVPELQTALDNAPNPEAACLPRANLALTLERLGDRYVADDNFPDAIDSYRQALTLWQEQQPEDVCYDDPEFREKAENSIPRLEEKLKQAAQDQQEQEQSEERGEGQGGEGQGGGQGGGSQGDGQTGEGEGQTGEGQGGEGQTGEGEQGQGQQGEGQQGDGQTGEGEQQGGGQAGEGESGPGGSGGTEQGGSGTGDGAEQGGGSQAGGEGEGGDDEISSEALGDKLDELRELGELSDRERQNAGHKQGLSNTPW